MRSIKLVVGIAAASGFAFYKGVSHANEWLRFQSNPAKYRAR